MMRGIFLPSLLIIGKAMMVAGISTSPDTTRGMLKHVLRQFIFYARACKEISQQLKNHKIKILLTFAFSVIRFKCIFIVFLFNFLSI